MTLDISAFEKALDRLDEGLQRFRREPEDDQVRDGLIQRFEFTYELAHKTLKRFLESQSATPGEFDTVDFQALIRAASEQTLLLRDWPAWRTYRAMRSKTSHTYDEDVAREVVAGIPDFLEEVRYLRARLRERLA